MSEQTAEQTPDIPVDAPAAEVEQTDVPEVDIPQEDAVPDDVPLEDIGAFLTSQIESASAKPETSVPPGVDAADWAAFQAYKAAQSKQAAPAPAPEQQPAAPAQPAQAEPKPAQPPVLDLTQAEYDAAFESKEGMLALLSKVAATAQPAVQVPDFAPIQAQIQEQYEQRYAAMARDVEVVALVNAALLNPENAALRKNIPVLEAALKYSAAMNPGADQWTVVEKAFSAVRDRDIIAQAYRAKAGKTADTREKTAKTTPGTSTRTDSGMNPVTNPNRQIAEAFRRS